MAISNTFFGDYQSNRLHIQLRIEGLAKALVRKFKTMDPGTWKVCAKNPLLLQFPNRGQDPQFSYSARRTMSDIWHCMKQTGHFHAERRQVCGQRYLQVQLNKYETDLYFLQIFPSNTSVCLIISVFCKSCEPTLCEPEIVQKFCS